MKTKKKSWFLIAILVLPLIEKMLNLSNGGKLGFITIGLAIVLGGITYLIGKAHYHLTKGKKWPESIAIAMFSVFIFFALIALLFGRNY